MTTVGRDDNKRLRQQTAGVLVSCANNQPCGCAYLTNQCQFHNY